MEYEKRVQAAVREIVTEGVVESSHDLGDGGLAVALAESSFGPAGIGASLRLDSDLRPELLLFHEGPSRILVSTAQPERVWEIAAKYRVDAPQIGKTVAGRIEVRNRGGLLMGGDIAQFKSGWEGALESYVRQVP